MHRKLFTFLRFFLVVAALGVAVFLAFFSSSSKSADHRIVFVLDINRTMNTQDVLLNAKNISRLQAAKHIIATTLLADPHSSYGLVLFNAGAEYILPPTFDTWTFLLYLNDVTTNLLPDWTKDFAQLTLFLHSNLSTTYLILSDFDAVYNGKVSLPASTSLLGMWSSAWAQVRTSNGILYYDNGKSVFSARNDQFAHTLGFPYTSLSDLTAFSPQKLLFHGLVTLNTIQYLRIYALLWVLVILAVLL